MNYRDNYRHNYYGEMSRSNYNLLIGGVLLWGFVINALMVKYATPHILGLNPLGLIIGYFALSIICMIISAKSDSAIVSFIGYNLVVVPVGAAQRCARRHE